MEEKVLLPGEPLQLAGSDFRLTGVNCWNCQWYGVAGQLPSTPDELSATRVLYHCPDCGVLLAIHSGLTHGELLRALDQIRNELRNEFLDLRLEQALQVMDPHGKKPEFKQVRDRLYAS